MRRRYDSNLYASRVEYIKSRIPDACIGVDVITGHPGETEHFYLDSIDFIDSLDVSYLHVFTYSERDNTHAITLPEIINPNTRSKRSRLLRLLSSRKKSDFYKSNIGTTNNVLFESENKNGYIEGFSENYIRFRTIWDPKLQGTIKQMKFNEIDPEGFAI